MSKILYHCIDPFDYAITLCGILRPRYNENAVSDFPHNWILNVKLHVIWQVYKRCPDCLAHEDYPLLVLAHV